MERISESTKATIDYFAGSIAYINVLRNMSVSCDCEGVAAAPVVTPNIGILASLDICAVDTASVDLVYALKEEDHLGMGNNKYVLIDLDNGECRIQPADAVTHVVPFVG